MIVISFLYADDSALLISDKDVGRIQMNSSKKLYKVRDWLSENKLMLHLGKTESIFFGSKLNLNKVSKLSVKVGDCLISNRTWQWLKWCKYGYESPG